MRLSVSTTASRSREIEASVRLLRQGLQQPERRNPAIGDIHPRSVEQSTA
jgi:hypothetical protein